MIPRRPTASQRRRSCTAASAHVHAADRLEISFVYLASGEEGANWSRLAAQGVRGSPGTLDVGSRTDRYKSTRHTTWRRRQTKDGVWGKGQHSARRFEAPLKAALFSLQGEDSIQGMSSSKVEAPPGDDWLFIGSFLLKGGGGQGTSIQGTWDSGIAVHQKSASCGRQRWPVVVN